MSIPFLGLGFAFGAKDKGLKKATQATTQGLSNVTSKMDEMSKTAEKSNLGLLEKGLERIKGIASTLNESLSLNRLQAFTQAISLSQLNDIARNLGDINSAGGNLTTSLEATVTASNKTAKAFAANFGMSGKAITKFTSQATSMGIALNISADEASKAIAGYSKGVEVFGKIGIKSASDLAKLASSTGIDVMELGSNISRLTQETGLSSDQISGLIGTMTAFGKQSKNVKGAIEKLPELMGLLVRNSALLKRGFKGVGTDQFAKEAVALGSAFYKMTGSSDVAQKMMMTFSESLLTAREDFAGMFAGVKDDLPDFIRELGISTGDIGQAFDMMQKGPAGIVEGLSGMVVQAKKSGKDIAPLLSFMAGRLEATLGKEQAATLVNFMSQANEETLKTLQTASLASASLGKVAREGFSTGRTLAEQYELVQGKFIMSFRDIGRKEAREFVKDTSKEFDKFNKKLKEIAGEGGTLGLLVTKMSEVHQIGVTALIPQALRPMATVFGSLVSEMTPAITALGALGFRFKMLVSPITLAVAAAAALGYWFYKLRASGKSTSQALESMANTAKDLIMKVGKILKDVGQQILKALPEVAEFVMDMLGRVPWEALPDMIVSHVKEISAAVMTLLRRALDFAKVIAPVIGDRLGKLGEFVGAQLLQALQGIAAIDFKALLLDVYGIIKEVFGVIVDAVIPLVQNLLTKLKPILITAGKGIIKIAGQLIEFIAVVLGDLGSLVKKHLPGIFAFVLQVVEDIVAAALEIVVDLVSNLPSLLFKLGDVLNGAIDLLVGAVIGLLDGLKQYLISKFPEVAEIIEVVFGTIFATLEVLGLAAKTLVTGFIDGVLMVGETIWAVFETAYNAIAGVFKFLWDIAGNIVTFLENLFGGFEKIVEDPVEGVKQILLSPVQLVKDLWGSLSGFFTGLFSDIANTAGRFFSNIGDYASSAYSRISDAASATGDALVDLVFGDDEIDKAVTKVKTATEATRLLGENLNAFAIARAQVTAATIKEVTNQAIYSAMANPIEKIHAQTMAKVKSALGSATAPTKSIIISDKDIKKIGPSAQKTFGKLGASMDAFGGKVAYHFEGERSIGELAEKAFNRVSAASTKWGKEFGTTITKVFTDIWTTILNITDRAIKAIRIDTQSTLGALRSLTATMGIAATNNIVKTGASSKPTNAAALRQVGNTLDEDLLISVNHPAWYENDYKVKSQLMLVSLQTIANLLSVIAAKSPIGQVNIGTTASGTAAADISNPRNVFTKRSTNGVPR